jgi:hypothetical protein
MLEREVRRGQVWQAKGYRYRVKVLRVELGERAWCVSVRDHRGKKLEPASRDHFYLSFNALRHCYKQVKVKA